MKLPDTLSIFAAFGERTTPSVGLRARPKRSGMVRRKTLKFNGQSLDELLVKMKGFKVPKDMEAVSPPGWSKTTEALKKHFPNDPSKAFKLAWYMKKHGAKSHIHNKKQLRQAEQHTGRWAK